MGASLLLPMEPLRSTRPAKRRATQTKGTSKPAYSQKHCRSAYRSGLEEANAAFLKSHGIVPVYEQYCIHYMIPARGTRYTPDFLLPNGIIVETKGRFLPEDRMKHILIKEQHPALDIRLVFTNSNAKLYKGSPTSYAQWCKKFGFQYADRIIPQAWLEEPPAVLRMQAVQTLLMLKESKKAKEVKHHG